MNAKLKLTEEDLELLNSPAGLVNLLAEEKYDLEKVLRFTRYEKRLQELQVELINMQDWIIQKNKKLVILCEGRDAAGKGGAIRRITAHINPRHYQVIALPKPTGDEAGQWYFQRYVNRLPKPGQIVLFDRSWYNRAVIEPVNGFCTQEEYEIFMGQVNQFEKMIVESDTILIKLYFSITKEEQKKRFDEIKKDPLKRWKMSPLDSVAQEKWDEYTTYKKRMYEQTSTDLVPWVVINANRKTQARIDAIEHILKTVPYRTSAERR